MLLVQRAALRDGAYVCAFGWHVAVPGYKVVDYHRSGLVWYLLYSVGYVGNDLVLMTSVGHQVGGFVREVAQPWWIARGHVVLLSCYRACSLRT